MQRRDYSFADHFNPDSVLPDFFKTDYPKLGALLEAYAEFNNQEFGQAILTARDITAVPDHLLQFIEDELLLGQSYFQGFANKREAAKYSNTLYRSKGTLFSIQQFFRTFFNIDVDVRYPKEDRFIVGDAPSQIGPVSQKFLTDDKLYQTYAIQIRAEIPIRQWINEYKLFVHPAGMFLGSQVLIETSARLRIFTPDAIPSIDNTIVEDTGRLVFGGQSDISGLITRGGVEYRFELPGTVDIYGDIPMEQIQSTYPTTARFIQIAPVRFDNDHNMDRTSPVSTFDQERVTMDNLGDDVYDKGTDAGPQNE